MKLASTIKTSKGRTTIVVQIDGTGKTVDRAGWYITHEGRNRALKSFGQADRLLIQNEVDRLLAGSGKTVTWNTIN